MYHRTIKIYIEQGMSVESQLLLFRLKDEEGDPFASVADWLLFHQR